MKKIAFLVILVALILNSCVNLDIKDEYPEIIYYQFEQSDNTQLNDIKPINAAILIRNFTISNEFDTKHIIANWDGKRVQRYFYHRWISEVPDMISDFIFSKMAKVKLCKFGPIKSSSLIVPDYIMEAQIINFSVNNFEKVTNKKNNVELEIKVNLIRRLSNADGEKIVYTEVYSEKIERENNLVSSVAPAFSQALSVVSDRIFLDMMKRLN